MDDPSDNAGEEQNKNGSMTWFFDPGWDQPMVKTKSRERFEEIDRW